MVIIIVVIVIVAVATIWGGMDTPILFSSREVVWERWKSLEVGRRETKIIVIVNIIVDSI